MDGAALVDALRSGHLGGAGLDTFEAEPLRPDHPLLALANVILTPHVAGVTRDAAPRVARRTVTAKSACSDLDCLHHGVPVRSAKLGRHGWLSFKERESEMKSAH